MPVLATNGLAKILCER